MTCLFIVSLASVNKKRFSVFKDFWLINFSFTCHAFNTLSRIENYPNIAKIFSSSLSFLYIVFVSVALLELHVGYYMM